MDGFILLVCLVVFFGYYRTSEILKRHEKELGSLREELFRIKLNTRKEKESNVQTPLTSESAVSLAASHHDRLDITPQASCPLPAPSAEVGSDQPFESDRPAIRMPPNSPWVDFVRAHWMTLLGGASLALAGIFFLDYSVRSGLLTPAMQLGLATAFGMALVIAAQWLKTHRGSAAIDAPCAGAGMLILYGCTLTSGVYFGYLSSTFTFLLLAALSFVAMGLALRHGQVLAALGILGAYSVPPLVQGDGHLAFLFVYLFIVSASGFLLLRYLYRSWLWWGIWLCAFSWLLLSLTKPDEAQGWRTVYLFGIVWAGFALPIFGLRLKNWKAVLKFPLEQQQSLHILWGVIAFLQWQILISESPSSWGYSLSAGLFVFALLLARHPISMAWLWPCLMLMPLLAAVTGWSNALAPPVRQDYLLMLVLYLSASLGIAAPFAWRNQHTILASLACAVPLILFLLVDWRLSLTVGSALGLFGYVSLLFAYCAALWLWRRKPNGDAIASVLIIAHQAALMLCLISLFEGMNLTLAIALQWWTLLFISSHFNAKVINEVINWLSRILLALVIARLVVMPWLLLSSPSAPEHQLVICLAIFASALLALMLLYSRGADRQWVLSFEVGVAQLAAIAIAALVRYQLYGRIYTLEFSWVESGIYVMTLLVGSAAYQYRYRVKPTQFLLVLADIKLLLALALYAVFALLNNPLLITQSISSTPIWNALLLVYGVPPILLGWQGWKRRDQWRLPILALSASMALLFLIMEIRHLWHGRLLPGQPIFDGELYSYSVMGLIIGIGLMVVAAINRNLLVQQCGTATLLVVIAKIFLWDMAGLDGLWRVASFMGLGLTLLGTAYCYNQLRIRISGQGRDLNEAWVE